MSPVQMPKEFLKAEKRPVSELEIGQTAWIEFNQVLVQKSDLATYVNPRAKAYPSGLVPLHFLVERTKQGFILLIPKECSVKPEFSTIPEMPTDAIPVVEIRMVDKL